MDKISLIKSVSNWQCQLLHFALTQLWIVLYQPTWIIYDSHMDNIVELFHIFIWCSLFSLISVKGFLILHDCCHNTFFDTPLKNEICGRVFSVLEACPFDAYKEAHLRHHVIQGNLDKIDADSIHWTVQQVDELPYKFLKLLYIIYRFPLIMFLTAPILLWFVVWPAACIRDKDPYVFIGYTVRVFGLWYFSGDELSFDALYWSAKINLITGYFAIFMGVILFHIQHSVNPGYRGSKSRGTFTQKDAAIQGASTHKVPWFLKFFTMGIEYHTFHHLDMGIPGYALQYYWYRVDENKDLKYELVKNSQIKKCTFDKRVLTEMKMTGYKDIYDCLFNVLWSEKKKRYISWSEGVKDIYF